MSKAGVTRLYAKHLQRNNNSKQQFYISRGDWSALQMLPMGEVRYCSPGPDDSNSTSHQRGNFKADLDFSWINEQARQFIAPKAQLILYPKYPEIRLGSLIQGAEWSPAQLLMQQQEGRILFLGIHPDQRIIAFMAAHNSEMALEYIATALNMSDGVLTELILPAIGDNRISLLRELNRIHNSGWIASKSLKKDGSIVDCNAPQCIGFTLEAELGIPRNPKAEPDYLGWEVKAHTVTSFTRQQTRKAISLFTPEPDGGFYKEHGLLGFLQKYGYPDVSGILDRINFGGVHRANQSVDNRKHGGVVTTLVITGYDRPTDRFTDLSSCGLNLMGENGTVLAFWSYAKLLTRWQKKHKNAVYVPGMKQTTPLAFHYGDIVRLGISTDIKLFFRAVADGHILYDPGHKVVNNSTNPTTKARSQFRIASRDVGVLYQKFDAVSVVDGSILS